MKKYMDPKMNINIFDVESIVTSSGGDTPGYDEWIQEKGASTGNLDFATRTEVQVDMGA